MKILGIMTGTSCDGLDAACLEVRPSSHGRPEEWQCLWSVSAEYPAKLKKRVLDLQKPGTRVTTRELLALNRDLGDWYARTASKMITSSSRKPDVIANHGQTVAHFPETSGRGTTLQLGDPTRIAAETGLTVVASFRDGDMAAGGEGAPLAPRFHIELARVLNGGKGVAIHNLGGISNLTYIGGTQKNPEVFAFDTGPANLWIDEATKRATRGKQTFDRSGLIAATGLIDESAVRKVLKLAYFKKKVPKSTGRDDFPFELLLSKTDARGADLVATATAVTALSIVDAYKRFVLKRHPLSSIFFCGGGARNETLVDSVAALLPNVRVQSLGDAGFDETLVECQAFAILGFRSLIGLPLGGKWTGVRSWAPPGHIIPGKNWKQVLSQLARQN
jgi:anhydro-N-acetylmuramic acid kinase